MKKISRSDKEQEKHLLHYVYEIEAPEEYVDILQKIADADHMTVEEIIELLRWYCHRCSRLCIRTFRTVAITANEFAILVAYRTFPAAMQCLFFLPDRTHQLTVELLVLDLHEVDCRALALQHYVADFAGINAEKMGACHFLVNAGELSGWVKK